MAGCVVALGKFEGLHLGHRALAERASALGKPIMLSLSGMAEVFGWEPKYVLSRSFYLVPRFDGVGSKPACAFLPSRIHIVLDFYLVAMLDEQSLHAS